MIDSKEELTGQEENDSPLNPAKANLTIVAEAADSLLRETRQQKKLSVDDIVRQTNIPKKYIEAIESQNYDCIPGELFITGYLRSYAGVLGLDADEVVEEYKYHINRLVNLAVDEQHEQEGKQEELEPALDRFLEIFAFLLNMLKSGKVQFALLGLVAFVVLILLPKEEEALSPVIEQVEVQKADGSVTVATLMEDHGRTSVIADKPQAKMIDKSKPELTETTAVESSGAKTINRPRPKVIEKPQPITVNKPKLEVVNVPVLSEERRASANEAAGPGSSQSVSSGLGSSELGSSQEDVLLLNFSQQSWVTVRDISNTIIHQSLKLEGEVLQLTGKVPFQVKLGYAPGVTISLNGEPVDFADKIRIDSQTAELTLNH